MARKPTKKSNAYCLDAGVGVNWQINANGWGLDDAPHLAVLVHPLKGMSMWGPFVTEDAAHAWVRKEGDGTAMHFFGEPGESHWHVTCIYVPTHPEAK